MNKLALPQLCVLFRQELPLDTYYNRRTFSPLTPCTLPIPTVKTLFSGSSFHWDCYWNWSERPRFAREQYARRVAQLRESTFHGLIVDTPDVTVGVRIREPYTLSIALRETGSLVQLQMEEWLNWSVDWRLAQNELHLVEWEALAPLIPQLRASMPDKTTIIENTNWEGTERQWYVP